jgi:pyruvate kinase
MIAAGMNVARINFAHGDFQSHAKTIAAVRDSAGKVGRRVAVRIGRLDDQPIGLEQGQAFTLAVGDFGGDPHRASTTFEGLPRAVKRGDTIFLNDGMIQLEVREVTDREVRCTVAVRGPLLSHKGIAVPDVAVDGSQPPGSGSWSRPGEARRRGKSPLSGCRWR